MDGQWSGDASHRSTFALAAGAMVRLKGLDLTFPMAQELFFDYIDQCIGF